MKRLIIATLIGLVIVVASVAAIPFFISQETINRGITNKLQELTGGTVSFEGDPSISFNPFLKLKISNLEIKSKPEFKKPLLKVEQVIAQLNVIHALQGKIEFNEYQLLRPHVYASQNPDSTQNWEMETGKLRTAIDVSNSNRTNQTDATLPHVLIGDMSIKDGIVEYEDQVSGTSETITSINGSLVWTDITQAISIQGNGIWRGEGITANINIDKPIEILSGGESDASVIVKSQPIAFTFNGQANMLANLFIKGNLEASAPSIARFAEVFELKLGDFATTQSWRANGKFEATVNNTNLSDANFSIGDSQATGVIRLSKNEQGNTKLDGTLAFQNIDLANKFNSLMQRSEADRPKLIDALQVDLRISSPVVTIGGITLERVAAAIIVDKESWSFDIGDATAFNGKLVAKLGERLSGENQQAFLEISATDMDSQSIFSMLNTPLVSVSGKTSFIANLRTNKLHQGLLNSGINGNFSGNVLSGNLTGIDLVALLAKQENAATPTLESFKKTKNTPFSAMNVKFFMNNGVAAISQSTLETNGRKIQAIGDINLYSGELDVQFQEITETGPQPKRIIIEGTTNEPVILMKNGTSQINQN